MNSLLTKLDRISSHIGPVNTLIEGVIDRVVPRATAKACTAPGGFVTCDSYCLIPDWNCYPWDHYRSVHYVWAPTFGQCNTGDVVRCDGCNCP